MFDLDTCEYTIKHYGDIIPGFQDWSICPDRSLVNGITSLFEEVVDQGKQKRRKDRNTLLPTLTLGLDALNEVSFVEGRWLKPT